MGYLSCLKHSRSTDVLLPNQNVMKIIFSVSLGGLPAEAKCWLSEPGSSHPVDKAIDYYLQMLCIHFSNILHF